MDLKRPNKLRISGRSGADETAPTSGDSALPASFPVNEVAELVADLIETTGLVSADRLAAVRGRVKQGGSFAQVEMQTVLQTLAESVALEAVGRTEAVRRRGITLAPARGGQVRALAAR